MKHWAENQAGIRRPHSARRRPIRAGRSLKRTLKRMPSELVQSSLPKDTDTPPAARPGREITAGDLHENVPSDERPRLRIIQDPISRLTPEMLYRQIQYLVEEGDWARQGRKLRPPRRPGSAAHEPRRWIQLG